MSRYSCLRLPLAFLGLLSITACNEDSLNEKLSEYIKEVKSRPAKPIEAIPTIKAASHYTYPFEKGRRDPFKIFAEKVKVRKMEGPDRQRRKQALEAYPLDALHFVGVLEQRGRTWGLISTPKGIVYRVRVGDYLGKNYGKISRIREDAISVTEMISVTGQWERKSTQLKLNNKE